MNNYSKTICGYSLGKLLKKDNEALILDAAMRKANNK